MNKKIFVGLFAFALSICTFFAQAQTKYLSGIYTIGGNNANYSSIQKAVTELLSTRTEVIGRVTFNIRPGIYYENITIKPFKGASAKNGVVFKSETGRAADVTIVDDGDNTLYNNSVIRLEGCKYVSFQDLTIENNRVLTSTNSFASVFHLTYNRDNPKVSADYNTINRCVLKLDSTFTIFNGNAIGIVSSDINNTSGLANCANYNSIINNTFYGGAFAIRLLGESLLKPCKGNKINNNKIYASICGIDVDYNNIPLIANNQIINRNIPSQAQFGIRVRNAGGNFGFYNNQIMYSKNGSGYLSKIENLEYYLGSKKSSVISRDLRNGILSPSESGFKINLTNKIKSIEFFYTPFFLMAPADAEMAGTSVSQNNVINAEINPNTETIDVTPAEVVDLPPKFSGLILQDSTETGYYWDSLGNVNKDNIDSIYVNSINVTSETNISNIFKYNNLYHVVINLTESIEGALNINHKSTGSVKALYQYMSFYQNSLDYNKINNHYKLYTSKQLYQTTGSRMSLSENSVNLYNNDWLVVQNS